MSDVTKMWIGFAGTVPFWVVLGVAIGFVLAR